jgi:hypothetical protein
LTSQPNQSRVGLKALFYSHEVSISPLWKKELCFPEFTLQEKTKFILKMEFNTRCWWLALVILATQEVGIRKMGI